MPSFEDMPPGDLLLDLVAIEARPQTGCWRPGAIEDLVEMVRRRTRARLEVIETEGSLH